MFEGLAYKSESNEYIRYHHTSISTSIHGILIERIIEKNDHRNTILTYIIIVIAIIAIIFSGFDIILNLSQA